MRMDLISIHTVRRKKKIDYIRKIATGAWYDGWEGNGYEGEAGHGTGDGHETWAGAGAAQET